MWTKKNVTSISKDITKEIRYILEGIRDGKLEHEQRAVHCGTAHCVAGWKEALDYKARVDNKSFFEIEPHTRDILNDDIRKFALTPENLFSSYGYAQLKWELNDDEAFFLFSASAILDDQFKVLIHLERGERYV